MAEPSTPPDEVEERELAEIRAVASALMDHDPAPPGLYTQMAITAIAALDAHRASVGEGHQLTPEQAQMVLNDLAEFDQMMGGGPDHPTDVAARAVLRALAGPQDG